MKNISFLTVIILLLAAISVSAQTKKSAIANPAKFQKIETDTRVPNCRSSLKTCGERALVRLDLAGFGGPDYIKYNTETFSFKNGVGIYLLTITGLKDPLTSGERIRLAFTKRGRTYRFVQAGKQYQCSRGKDAGKWQKACMPDGSMFPSGDRKFGDKNSTMRSEIENADDFRFVSINGRAVGEATKPCYEDLLTCGSTKIGFYGIEGVGGDADNPNFKEETFVFADKNTGKNIGVYLLTQKGFEDDSVSGERLRLEFEKRGNAWMLVQGGKQFQCARSANVGSWTKSLCP